MIGGQIARVTASRNERFPVGACIYGKFGWQTHTVTNPEEGKSGGGGGGCGGGDDKAVQPMRLHTPYVLPDVGGLAGIDGDNEKGLTLALGCLGVTG